MSMFSQVLRNKVLPWAEAGVNNRIVVARRQMKLSDMPSNVELAHRKITEKRVIVKGGRNYGNARSIVAEWPKAQMHEVNAPRFICVVDGQVKFRVGNYELGCGSGNFILIPPGIPHPGRWEHGDAAASGVPGQLCRLIWIGLYQRGVQCWFSRYDDNGRLSGTATENYLFISDQVTQLFKLFIDEAMGEGHEELCNKMASAFFIALQRETIAQRYLHPGPFIKTEAPSVADTDFLLKLTQYIQQHLHQPLRLNQVAREFYMSPTQFMRHMRQEADQTFVEFLTSYRIQEAKILLRESEWSVQTIASFVGFTSSTYFHALFQRQAGCTPGEFRLQKPKATSKKNSSKIG